MGLVAGLDFGGSAVKACVADVETGALLAAVQQPTETQRPAPGRAEFDPADWWRAAGEAMRAAVAQADRPTTDYVAVSATSLRQGYVLLDGTRELGPGVLNSDRRGEGQLERIRRIVGPDRLYRISGHWSAPQLTLPKLLEEQRSDARRWERTTTMLFVHDWALWRLCGERVSEPSMASAGQLLDIERRAWATDLLEELGLDPRVLPPLHDPGTPVGRLRDRELGLPLGLAVIVGGGDTQMAAAGAGGLADGVMSIVAGTTTPLQASVPTVPRDPQQHPWVSAHLVPGRWAAETNAGYTGLSLDWLARMTGTSVAELAEEATASPAGAAGISALVTAPTWSEQAWSRRAPSALIGFDPGHGRADVALAFMEAHAYAIRSNLEDLERAVGARARRVCLLGGAARSRAFSQLVADVTGRAIDQTEVDYPAGHAFAWLAARTGGHTHADSPAFRGAAIEPASSDRYEESYMRFITAADRIGREFAGWAT